jgi:hypothetical protein
MHEQCRVAISTAVAVRSQIMCRPGISITLKC